MNRWASGLNAATNCRFVAVARVFEACASLKLASFVGSAQRFGRAATTASR